MELTSIEVKHWLDENKDLLINSKIEKIWQIEDFIIIRLYVPKKGSKELVIGNGLIFFTSYYIEKPTQPTNFAMLLRKYLKGKRISEVYQHELDRIIIFDFNDYRLIVELLKPTNIILTDKNSIILAIMRAVKSKNRVLMTKQEYVFPPHKRNILNTPYEEFEKLYVDEKSLVGVFGIPPLYAQHIHKIARTKKEAYDIIMHILSHKKPCIYDNRVLAYCINDQDTSDNLNELIESKGIENIKNVVISTEGKKKKKGKIEYMIEGLEKLEKEKEKLEMIAEWYTTNITKIEEVLNHAKENKNHSSIIKINYESKIIDISTPHGKILLDMTKNVYQNLTEIYNRMKLLKEKIKNLEERIENEKSLQEKELTPRKIKVERKKEKAWYEKFKWFITSKNRLFVLGKDASTNEALIKKYMEKEDLVFHMLLPGSGFGLLKGGRDKADEEEILECAQFTASHSSLWKQKVFSGEVFWVYPEQVSKTPPSGEYLAKGSFMIYGKKNILNIPLELAFGFDREKEEIIYGPFVKILKRTKDYAVIIPGDKKAKDLISKIKIKISKNLPKEQKEYVMKYDDEFFRERIPFGMGDIRGKV